MEYDVFISYSSKDKVVADAVCSALEARNVRCWIAPRDIPPGSEWAEAIVKAIGTCKVMVLVFSTHANQSVQVRREVQHAFDNGVTVIPFRIEQVAPTGAMSYYLHGIHWLDALTPEMDRHREKLATKVLANLPPRELSGAQDRTPGSGDDAPFQRLDTVAELTIETVPPGATVYLDKQRQVGATPLTLSVDLVLEESRTVEVATELDGYRSQAFQATLARGKSWTLPTVTLRPVQPPLAVSRTPEPVAKETGVIAPRAGTLRVNPKDGAEMVFIPAGEFLMGDADQADNPRHIVTLSGYWIYKNLVTVNQYKQFCQETGGNMPPEPGGYKLGDVDIPNFNPNWSKEDHPIVNVSWEDAKAYCDWAGVRLPTEAEWEKAARGTESRKYPWGDDFDTSKLWCSKRQLGDASGTTAVGRYGISPYGLSDMAGNVWQWCSDWYDSDYWSDYRWQIPHGANPAGPLSGTNRVVRGSAWFYAGPGAFRSAIRAGFAPGDWGASSGFRGACGL